MAMKIILSVFIAWVTAQLIKAVILSWKMKKCRAKYFLINGHMPSSHASVVCALSAAVFFEQGFSILFATAAVFSIIILSDSFGLRQDVKRNSMKLWKLKRDDDWIGHDFKEVFVGSLVGIFSVLAVYLI